MTADKRAHRDINIDRGVSVEDCATMEKMIFIPTLKPMAQGGVRFSDFHAPPCADFRTILSEIDFGAPLAHLARLPSFSNLKLVCPLCPPRLHHASTTPAPRPRPTPAAPEFDRLKSLYWVGAGGDGWQEGGDGRRRRIIEAT
jgi:hypothetical protein